MKPHKLEVGHILYSSWGYDQTNVDFYQVTRLIGYNSVEIRPIGSIAGKDTGYMTGTCFPAADQFTGEPMVKRVDGRTNTIKIASYSHARLWDGRAICWSSYA